MTPQGIFLQRDAFIETQLMISQTSSVEHVRQSLTPDLSVRLDDEHEKQEAGLEVGTPGT